MPSDAGAVIVGGQIPGAEDEPSECALHVHGETGVCAFDSDMKYLRGFLKSLNDPAAKVAAPKGELIEEIKKVLGVTRESEIWAHPQFRDYIGDDVAQNVLRMRFKTNGPATSTALLDNRNIDDTLEQWSIYARKLFGKKFYHVPFQMIDFAYTGGQLADLDMGALKQDGYDCFGVVINTDRSSGRGKHWFCLYGDMHHTGTKEDPLTLEYFNSSGNPPMNEIAVWMEKACFDLLKTYGLHCKIIRSMDRRIQMSHTECGMWSLLYIKSRLENHPPQWFYTVGANDKDMIDYRKHLFRI